MDPLIVARAVRELPDAALIELHPARYAQFLTDKPVYRFEGKGLVHCKTSCLPLWITALPSRRRPFAQPNVRSNLIMIA